jgi:thiamine-phosphate pyrophosphorylase
MRAGFPITSVRSVIMPLSISIRDNPLMFITDHNRSLGRTNAEVVRAALKGGLKWVQFREPDLSDRDFYDECLKIRDICDDIGAGLIVNDRLDVASLIRAQGVHLGANDLPVRAVRGYVGEDVLIGYSAHSIDEAVTAAWEGADYITYSPMFPLEHKSSPHKPFGLDGAKEILGKVKIPVFFLGGIRTPDLHNLSKSVQPLRIACVSMISEAENITKTVEEILEILK